MAAEQNYFGIDPQLVDPENGDYRVADGSPAEGAGCQTFSERNKNYKRYNKKTELFHNFVRDEEEISGNVTENTIWSADTIRVVGDIVIEDGITLQIEPGTTVLFDDYYKLEVFGTLLAEGTAEEQIRFASSQGDLYSVGEDLTGCWQGIIFDETSALNNISRFTFCEFNNCKSLGMEIPGSVFTLYNFSKLIIENSTFSKNYAEYGGAIYSYKNSNPVIVNNLFMENTGFYNSSVLYAGYSYPEIYNNTMIGNNIINDDIFWETAAIQCFISKPKLKNNIIRENECSYFEDLQVFLNKDFYTYNNNIEGYESINGNFPDDPLFSYAPEIYSLMEISPCVDAGIMDMPYYPVLDLAGNERVYNEIIDIGCFEYQPESEVENYEINDLISKVKNYPNPFNPKTRISFFIAEKTKVEIRVFDVRGKRVENLCREEMDRGEHNISWNGLDTVGNSCASGIYFYEICAGEARETGKMLLLK